MNLEEKIEHLARLISRYGFSHPPTKDELDIMTRLEFLEDSVKRIEDKLDRLEQGSTKNA
jgi:hypothetical protein